tara:strand:+ start:835 stop:1059 length:225 start_codon:yes stop_codon:yes gene_type:complete
MATTNEEYYELKAKIIHQKKFIDVKPYSHNIISLLLQAIADGWGQERANQTIEACKLEELGWHKTKINVLPKKN